MVKADRPPQGNNPGTKKPRKKGSVPSKLRGNVARTGVASPAKTTKVAPAAPRKASTKPATGKHLERLQKILAHSGVASRRACEQLILEGHVQVNGETVTELGTKADPALDQITVDFNPVQRESLIYLVMNKPKGYVTTVKDDEGRPTVMALLHGIDQRVYPVGRLDFNSEGLILFTNDGELAQRLMDPDYHVPKIYAVKVHRTVPKETLDEFQSGFRLDGRKLKPCAIEILDRQPNPWLQVTLTEGKNQQIRRMFAAVGHPVHKLRRIQYGPINDPRLKPGDWRFLTPQEILALKNL